MLSNIFWKSLKYGVDKYVLVWYNTFEDSNRREGNTMFDYSKLLGLMAEKGFTKKSLAEAIRMSVNALINKFKGRSCFSSEDIASICNVLDISVDRIGYYFFTLKV